MAAKSKRRLFKIENKLLKLDKLTLEDVLCSICQSILTEPVTLPCFHDFCKHCFNGSIENNALCCPLCRLRIGSWLRTATKQNNLVNKQLWEFIKSKFQNEIDTKSRGEDLNVSNGEPASRLLCQPGAIRLEYESEINRLRNERIHLEKKHLHETEVLVKQLQNEEEEANRNYIEKLKQDELLAREIQESSQNTQSIIVKFNNNVGKLKTSKIDSFFIKKLPKTNNDKDRSQPSDDNTSTTTTTPSPTVHSHNSTPSVKIQELPEQKNVVIEQPEQHVSPELVPTYGSYLKTLLNSKTRNVSDFWNKKKEEIPNRKVLQKKPENLRPKRCLQSLPVSLPFKGLLQRNQSLLAARPDSDAASSVDSIQQEFCYFKPIDVIDSATPTGLKESATYPLKVPALRVPKEESLQYNPEPSRDDYLDRLCELRKKSLDQNLPSAFVISHQSLQVTENYTTKLEGSLKLKIIKTSPLKNHTANGLLELSKRTPKKHSISTDNVKTKRKSLRRTRSTGSIPKNQSVNETTPKKAKIKERKVVSERKPFLRSDSLRAAGLSPAVPQSVINNINVKSVVKQLSSPLKDCDVKVIVEEQFRIEKLLEQEKRDLELARQLQSEWNTRPLRRGSAKRPAPLDPLRPHKRLRA